MRHLIRITCLMVADGILTTTKNITKMKKIMLFFAVATILAACNNDNEVLNETQYITEFKADFGADTRMTATADNGLKFAWQEGDELYVFQADGSTMSHKYYKYDESTKTFKANTEANAMEADKQYFAVYGYRTIANPFTIVDGQIQFKAYLDNSKDVTNIPLISDVFTADADGTITAMHHTVGVVEVPVKLAAASTSTTLKNLGFYISSGYSSLDFIATPASPYFKEATNTTVYARNTWANMGDKVLSETEATSIFIPVLPGEYTNPGLNYSYNGTSSQKSLNGTLKVKCGEVTLMPVQELTLD